MLGSDLAMKAALLFAVSVPASLFDAGDTASAHLIMYAGAVAAAGVIWRGVIKPIRQTYTTARAAFDKLEHAIAAAEDNGVKLSSIEERLDLIERYRAAEAT